MNSKKIKGVITDISLGKTATLAGSAYLIIFILGIFDNFFIFKSLIVPGNASLTANNVIANEQLFRWGTSIWLFVLILDVIIAWALYIFLKPVNKMFSLLAGWFRIVYTAIFGITQILMFIALEILSNTDYLSVFTKDQLNAFSMMFIKAHDTGFLISLVFFGVHCLLLGYLVIKSDYIPHILGFLLIAASFGYIIDSFAHFLISNYVDYEMIFLIIVAVPAIIAELSFPLWMLIKGSKIETAATP